MPYNASSELPDGVKSHLPEHAHEIYNAAFNNAWDNTVTANRALIAWPGEPPSVITPKAKNRETGARSTEPSPTQPHARAAAGPARWTMPIDTSHFQPVTGQATWLWLLCRQMATTGTPELHDGSIVSVVRRVSR